jgi:putative ABC transport system permease protein
VHSLLQDIRFGVRMLARSRGFTVIALITLVLGIGANIVLFSAVHLLLMKPQKLKEPDDLVYLRTTDEQRGGRFGRVSTFDYEDWRAQAASFEDMALLRRTSCILTGQGEPRRITAVQATANLLPLLGMEVQLGRRHNAEEDHSGAGRVVMLAETTWRRQFGASPAVLGRSITLDDGRYTIIGVLPARLGRVWLWDDVDVWMPLPLDEASAARDGRSCQAIARVREGVTIERAQTEMSRIAAQLAAAYPETNADRGVWVQSLPDWIFPPEARLGMKLLLAAAGLVLMIACANLATLLVVRATARGREFAVRAALGAGRLRLVRQLMTESALLALVGGVLGLLAGLWGVDILVASFADTSPDRDEVGLNAAVLAYTLFISSAAAIVFGLAPALRASGVSVGEALKEGAATASAGLARHRLRNTLVVGQMAVALPLLVCAALLVKSLFMLSAVEMGFEPANLLTMQIDLPRHRYENADQHARFFDDAVAAVAATPGVEGATAISAVPLANFSHGSPITIEGRAQREDLNPPSIPCECITPGYFDVMQIPLIRGRGFTPADVAHAEPVAIVNERMAAEYWPADDPIGKRFRRAGGAPDEPWMTVVGVVGGTVRIMLQDGAEAQFFMPLAQDPAGRMFIVARTVGEPADMAPALRAAIAGVDPDQPVFDMRTMDDLVARRVLDGAAVIAFIAGLGLVALILACVGLYGVISCSVAQRTHEIGVRVALGAGARDIRRLVLRRCLTLSIVAIVIGLLAALALSRVLSSVLYEVSPADPTAYAGIAVVLLAVGLLAGYLPARRATKVDPMVALRCE